MRRTPFAATLLVAIAVCLSATASAGASVDGVIGVGPEQVAADAIPLGWQEDVKALASIFWAGRGTYTCNPLLVELTIVDEFPGWKWGQAPIGGCEHTMSGLTTAFEVEKGMAEEGWRAFCVLSLHEWGHLVGRVHGGGWRALMHAEISPWLRKWKEPCDRNQLAGVTPPVVDAVS